jgi:hypothetical protein
MNAVGNTDDLAARVAELIHADATSGSGAWDELDGPDATLTQVSGYHTVIIAHPEYDDTGNPVPKSGTVTVITVETFHALV